MMPQKNAPQQLDAPGGGDASSPDPHGGETVGVRRKEAKKGVVPARGKFEVKKAGYAEALERMFVGKVAAAEKFSGFGAMTRRPLAKRGMC